jgi:acyl carrier protein
MEYVQMTLDDWVQIKQKLKQELLGVKQSFVRIGYALRQIDDQKLYERDGYKSVAEFAKAEYGLEPSTTSRFMSINREYSIDGYSEQLRPEYAELGRSQLEEMLKLPDSDRQMIQPETSREDIRELKRFNKTEPAAGEADDIRQLVEKFYQDHMEVLNAVFSEVAEFGEPTTQRFKEIVNPGGNRSYKKGLFFLMMYENRVSVKRFGSPPQDMTWEEFYQMTMDIFGASAAGPKTWQNYFGTEEEIPERTEPEEQPEQVELKEAASAEPEKRKAEEDIAQQEYSQPQEKMTGTADKNVVEQEEPELFEEKNPRGKPVKTEIAPAQKSEEIQEKQGMDEPASEDCEVENETLKVENETPGAENEPLEVETPYETRKEYMDSLTTYELAGYLADEYRIRCKKEMDLGQQEKVYEWLKQRVDGYGKAVEEYEED